MSTSRGWFVPAPLPAAFVAAVAAALVAACSSPLVTPSAAPPSVASTSTPATPTSSPTPSPTARPTKVPTASPVAVTPTCKAAGLAARITLWDHGAGHAMASVEVTNKGAAACRMPAVDKAQLVDGHGSVIIDGAAPPASSEVHLGPGTVLKTLVEDSNYCGQTPDPPVTVAFVFPDGLTRFVATPLSATDASGVPPCNGAPGTPGDIEMQPWGP